MMDDQGFTPAMLLDSHNKSWTQEDVKAPEPIEVESANGSRSRESVGDAGWRAQMFSELTSGQACSHIGCSSM